YDSSLTKALHRIFFIRFWSAGICRLAGDTLRTTTPLVTRLLLTWLTSSYEYYRLSDEQKASGVMDRPKGIHYGIGLGFALFAMQGTIFTNHTMHLSMTTGLLLKSGIIGSIFLKSMRLSGRARLEHSVGKITNMISADASEYRQLLFSASNLYWVQIMIVVGLLFNNLGYSALVGFGVLVFSFPMQVFVGRIMVELRQKSVKITDARVLQGIRLLKFYTWEAFYSFQMGKLHQKEIRILKQATVARSALIATSTFIPILSSILSFITYGLTGHDFNIAIIFSSLQLFNIIRTPFMFLPLDVTVVSDGLVAMGRVSKFLTAEELPTEYVINEHSNLAVEVNGTFTWEIAEQLDGVKLASALRDKPEKRNKQKIEDKLPISKADVDGTSSYTSQPFELQDLCMTVLKGSFVAIVGRVGSGKSSILQALTGGMRRVKGEVIFGGSVAYAPQVAWIRNATLRENILFGQELDEDRLQEVISACGLERDLTMQIGEKGINLSGGQKARVSLVCVAYSPSNIVLLDDPLSAVDACVGRFILDNCMLKGPLASKTRILVTHALHVLDKVDYIYVVDEGVIKEQGTYTDLIENSVIFSRIMEEYGTAECYNDALKNSGIVDINGKKVVVDVPKYTGKHGALIRTEERYTGSVARTTYRDYLRLAGGVIWAPILLLLLVLNQCSRVGNTVFLGFWTADGIHGFTQGQYMAVYAGIGVSQAVFTFLVAAGITMATLIVSLSSFKTAFTRVLRSRVSFFDTTPVGRILLRLSKDQDILDNRLTLALTQFLNTFSSVVGTFALIFYIFPLLGIILFPTVALYYFLSLYYRRTSVETKRLSSLMRSAFYSSYSETLAGFATIRAFREQDRYVRSVESSLDLENRAHYRTISIQRWLGVRLGFFGNFLVLGIALFAAAYRKTIHPSKIGVALIYTLNITQTFATMVTQFAQNEQNMSAVERVLLYTQLPSEGNGSAGLDEPSDKWPEKGSISFEDVDLAYREGLPLVLCGVSFKINPGEKVGIVGRTRAGKSSLVQALFRIVELQGGSIQIDGHDISKIELDTLRSRLALVPQDTDMFLGTMRHNLDPQSSRTDAELISVLQRVWLLPPDGVKDPVTEARFSFDAIVGDEGSNFSAGEKQLLALGRALVKNSRIIVLDEATSSVDVETDAKLQRTIQTEFSSATVLCIAHRLNTIAYYDHIMVMDAGKVVEFDTVMNLFDKEDSAFRSLCNEANLQQSDVERIRIG
ncbi:multidrug resistance-associated ABC transporter, partial [Armillaria nabsnona]